jgi:hypothetical protein
MAFTNNASPSRLGQANKAGDTDALFQNLFSAEILATYLAKCVTEGTFMVKNIRGGKSASFPKMGRAAAKYHVPGQSLIEGDNGYLNLFGHGTITINVDDVLIAPAFVADIDELKNYYDVRAPYAKELGAALAEQADKLRLRMAVKAARTTSVPVTGLPTGTVLNKGATVATTATVLASAIFEAGTVMDEKNVPEDGRFAFLSPRLYDLLAQSKDVVGRDYGAAGVYSEGTVFKINNITLRKTNHLPTTNIGAGVTGEKNDYTGDFTNTVAVVTNSQAIGSVKLMDIAFESERQMERQGTLMLAKMAHGHGILRPECAVEISKAV